MPNSRNKGATFERELAKELFLQLGITFKRDLRQYQESDHGDLLPDDDAFPFTIEVKHYAEGNACKDAWKTQVIKAADKTGKYPVVIYKFNRKPIRCHVWFGALAEAFGGEARCGLCADLDLVAFCEIAREIMAKRSLEAVA